MNIQKLDRPLEILLISREAGDGQLVQEHLSRSIFPQKVHLHLHQSGYRLPHLGSIDCIIVSVFPGDTSFIQVLQSLEEANTPNPIVLFGIDHVPSAHQLPLLERYAGLEKASISPLNLFQAISWALKWKHLESRLLQLEDTQQNFRWEVDIRHNRFSSSPALTAYLGKPVTALDQYLHLVEEKDQHRLASTLMQSIRSGKDFSLSHQLAGRPETLRMEGKVELGPDGKGKLLYGHFHIYTPTPKEAAPAPVPPQNGNGASHTPQHPVASPPTPTPKVEEPSPVAAPAKATSPEPTSYRNGFIPGEKHTNINYLKQVSGGDKDIMRKAISKFLETTPEMISQLDTQLSQQDFEQLAKTAHKLKSSVGLMGMEDLQKTVQNIEFVSKSRERLDVLPILIGKTKKILTHSLTELEMELSDL